MKDLQIFEYEVTFAEWLRPGSFWMHFPVPFSDFVLRFRGKFLNLASLETQQDGVDLDWDVGTVHESEERTYPHAPNQRASFEFPLVRGYFSQCSIKSSLCAHTWPALFLEI